MDKVRNRIEAARKSYLDRVVKTYYFSHMPKLTEKPKKLRIRTKPKKHTSYFYAKSCFAFSIIVEQ